MDIFDKTATALRHWQSTLEVLPGVGPQLVKLLNQCGLFTCGDLCLHFPLRYENRSQVYPISEAPLGKSALLEVTLLKIIPPVGRKKTLQWIVGDKTAQIEVTFFKPYKTLYQKDWIGKPFRLYGEIKGSQQHKKLQHPDIEWPKNAQLSLLSDHYWPVYSTTPGLSQNKWRQLQQYNLACLSKQSGPEWPEAILKQFQAWPLNEALKHIHFPAIALTEQSLQTRNHPAWRRLLLEELIVFQQSLQQKHQRPMQHAEKLPVKGPIFDQFLAHLPFRLTDAQTQVIAEIQADICQSKPMLRLVQGDVGSGKTVVATVAMLSAVMAESQAAFMAPTEILAEQHFVNLNRWLAPLGIRCALLTGSLKHSEKRALLADLLSGSIQILIGTHALFQDQVQFKRLVLVVMDEQHRFGVHQRLQLWQKGQTAEKSVAHQLIMTATPIPRTLAMSTYAMMDHSVITTLPSGRQPIQTVVISKKKLEQVYEKIDQIITLKQQVYWVCPLIEESEQINAQAATAVYQQLCQQFPKYRIGLVHGRLKSEEKAVVFRAFTDNEIQILVATTVIEVGVDVPNATLMIIEDPERLGLAQLHQIRGRVGRGVGQSVCLLLYEPPLSPNAVQRLQALRDHTSGFALADIDLRLRGAGEVLGVKQTGLQTFRVARFPEDAHDLENALQLIGQLTRFQPEALENLWLRWQGSAEEYIQV